LIERLLELDRILTEGTVDEKIDAIEEVLKLKKERESVSE
jgi:hypothetical protein